MFKFTLACLLCVFTASASAQSTDANFTNWSAHVGANRFFRSGINFVEGEISIKESISYTAGFKRMLPFQRAAGLSYTFVPTVLSFTPDARYATEYDGGAADMNIHFINTNATQYIGAGPIVGFFDAGVGLAIYDITSEDIKTRTHFLMSFGAGVEYAVTERIGIRLNGGLKLPLFASSNGVYCGIGSSSGVNCGLSLNSGVIMTHWELGGAAIYNF
ncbi:acyloxyacyl hydrolase [Neolewinella antarctica]|uniref:Opacity protein-like surface antigen n=1 Tax=Neolewinella antarctica TaxID=442734 RepID=A0ABX0X9G4_9BACT|nr:acyloxyacyl hydrolase [Neolewinella antarctica]NJC25900.1 opacity protein-like surface antigen [Neolewinella antarctica]